MIRVFLEVVDIIYSCVGREGLCATGLEIPQVCDQLVPGGLKTNQFEFSLLVRSIVVQGRYQC